MNGLKDEWRDGAEVTGPGGTPTTGEGLVVAPSNSKTKKTIKFKSSQSLTQDRRFK